MTTTLHAQESNKNKLSSSTMHHNDTYSNDEDKAFLFQCPSEHVKELNAVKSAFAISHHYFDGWIYLFLANKKYDVAETIAKLKRRADMEQHVFRHYTITPSLRASMRAGIVQYIGDDKAGRPVLYFNTSRDQPKASERAERQANFDIFLSWSLRLQRSNPTSGVTWLINQHHASLLRNTDLVFQKDMALRTSKFYPGTVARMYLCNMNSALTFVMKPLLRQLPKAISETIFMYSNHDLKSGKLLEVMDDHVLPIAMGGSNDCDHPSNYEWFANQVEQYFSRCVHALNNHISIKEMEMMEEFHVDVHGRPLKETVKRTYESNYDKNEIEETKKATKVDQNKATGHDITDTTEKTEEFRASENKQKEEEEVKEQKQRLEHEEQLTRSPLSAKEIQTNNTTTSNMKSTSITVQHKTYTINCNNNKNNNSNASNNLLSLLVDGNDDNDDDDDVNSDDSNLKTPIEVCSDDDVNIGCGEYINNKRKDKHKINTNEHSYEITNKQKDNNIYNSKEDSKRKMGKNNYSTNEEVNSVLEIVDGHKGLARTKNANDVNLHKNGNNIETNNESPHVYFHDNNNIPFSHVSHVLEQTPLSVAFDDDQVVITSNRYKSEVRWNDRHVADELPLDISYNNSNNNNTNIEATKKDNKNNVIEEHVTNTQSIEREFSLHDSFASGLISTPINDLLSFNTQLHERHEGYLINNNNESKSSEGNINKEENQNELMEAEQMASKDVFRTNNAGNKIEETKMEVNNNNNNENEQSIQLAKQLEFAFFTSVNNNNNTREKSTLAECATSKEYREFVSYYISYKVIEIAKHIKCNKPDEINALKENWNAFVDVCYTLQHPVEHIVHVLHGQTTNKALCNTTFSCINCSSKCRDDNIGESECCANNVESVVEFIKAHVSDITRLIQHLLLLSVPSSHVLYILSNGCISATSSPFITEEDYSCKGNQEHNNNITNINAITTKETIEKWLFKEKEQHQVNTKEESMLECTSKENNNELVSLLEPLQVDCTSADNLLLSLQASTVVFVEQCEQMIELHKTYQRVLRRTLLKWSNKLSRDEYVIRLSQRAQTLWHELIPWLRQYIECKVHMVIASFMAHYGLLIAHGKIDTTSNWYKTLFRSILHFREVHRHSWLFHLLPPFTFTNTQKQTQNINITNNSSKLLSEPMLRNIKEEVLEEEEELCFHVHAPSVSELLNKSHLPESTEGLCTLIVMVETSLKATLQQLQKITSMAAQWQVNDDPASPTFPATSEANSKTVSTTNNNNTSKSKIKNSSFFGKTMENLTNCNSYNNSNQNDSFANSTQLSQRNNNNSNNNNNTSKNSNTTTIPPILYTNHYIIDRYLEYSHARISIPFESQSMGLSPVEMIISEQIKACAFLTAAETPLKEFLFTNASLYLLSSGSVSSCSHELTNQIQLNTPSKNEQGKELNQKQEREEEIICEKLYKELEISNAFDDSITNKQPNNSSNTTTSLVADDEANVMMNSFSQDNNKSTDQVIQANHNLDNVQVKSESSESLKSDIDNHNTDFDKTRSHHTKQNADLDLMQKIGCNKESHSTGNNCVLADLKRSINKYNKYSNAESTPEANKMQTTEKHYFASQLSKLHHALKEERCQRRICTALAMAAYHVQCNGTIYGYGGTDDTDEFIKTLHSCNKSNIEEKMSADQIVCRHEKHDNAHGKQKEQKATNLWNNNVENISTNEVSIDNNDANNWYEWPSYGFGLALQLMEMLAYLTWHDESKQSTKIENEQQQQLENEELSIRDGNVFERNDTNKSEEKKRNNAFEKEHWEETVNQQEELLPSATLVESPTDTHNVVEQNVYLYSSNNNTNNSNTINTHDNKKRSNFTSMSMNTETPKTKLLQDVQVLIDNARHANEYALPVAEAKRQYIFMTFTN